MKDPARTQICHVTKLGPTGRPDLLYILDQAEEGHWLASWPHHSSSEKYPIGRDKAKAQAIVDKLNRGHRPNLKVVRGDLYVCWHYHEKAQLCEYKLLVEDAYGQRNFDKAKQRLDARIENAQRSLKSWPSWLDPEHDKET